MHIPFPGKQERNLYKGKEEKSIVLMYWSIPLTFSEKDFITAAVLNEYLDIRLTEEIREKLGGVYSISPSVGLTPMPSGELYLVVTFYCDPNRAEELAAAVSAELDLTAQGHLPALSICPDAFSHQKMCTAYFPHAFSFIIPHFVNSC